MKKWFTLLILLPFLIGCSFQKEPKKTTASFESLMGKVFPAWQFVQSQEDRNNLLFYKTLYDTNSPLSSLKSSLCRIPKTIHIIWLGPKPFPLNSLENIRTWIAHHPDWTIKFWTDRDRPLPHPKMQLELVHNLKFFKLLECYKKADNYGEKSDILCYEILHQEGGLCIDHDIKCLKSFDNFNKTYDFYCGLELPCQTYLSSCIQASQSLIASRPGHPILNQTIDWLAQHWDDIEKAYPGKDSESVLIRMIHRTCYAFAHSVRSQVNQYGNVDIVFPALYFNAPTDKSALYSRHFHEERWLDRETLFEKSIKEEILKINKKSNRILMFVGILSLINVMGLTLLFLKYRKNVYNA
jgi:mannosyltransferase OCH1-like enzyme